MIRNLIIVVLFFCWSAVGARAQDARLRVVLDSSFAGPTYQAMQKIADQVVEVVDQLIPGSSAAGTDILCFAPPPEFGHAPITLVGSPQLGEPAAAANYSVRVAVSRSVLPADQARFVFQLAHELGHVRMDPRFDNEIIETFAVAVSFEVLARMGYGSYLSAAEQSLIDPLPGEIKDALAHRSWNEVNLYLKQQRQYHQQHPFDYSLAAAGAILLRATHALPWGGLAGIAEKNLCPAHADPPRFQFCPLNESALPEFLPVFRMLGGAAGPEGLASSPMGNRANEPPSPRVVPGSAVSSRFPRL